LQRPISGNAYRESDILSASPSRLVVITFDGLLAAMTRARVGIALSNFEVTLAGISKSREFLSELLVSLNHEQGGEIARHLSALYVFVLGELHEISRSPDVRRLERNIKLVRELRDAFAQVASSPQAAVA